MLQAACILLRLLEDDGEWVAMFRDGQEFMTGRALHHLFAMVLQHTTITNPLRICQQFGNSFCDDLSHLIGTGQVVIPAYEADMDAELALDYGLYHIQQYLNEYGKFLAEFGLPHPVLDWANMQGPVVGNLLVTEEMGYEVEQQRELASIMRHQLNEEQVASFDKIVAAVESYEQDPHREESQTAFFLHGPAGTGKTFLYNCLGSYLRAQGKILLCLASSGIAAQLLPGGRTAHSRVKIPLSNDVNAVCNITANSNLGLLIQKTSLII